MSEWISVYDRMPDRQVDVLVVWDFGGGPRMDVCCWDGEEWYELEGSIVGVSHWMPLPEPPKESK